MFRFLFNRLSPSLTIIILLILVIVILGFFFRKKSPLLLQTILGPVIGIGIIIVIVLLKQAIKKPVQPMSSTAMFKKMEYIEHLKLVSFYSEEIMVLGTKEKVQKLVDKLTSKQKEMEIELAVKDSKLLRKQEELDALIVAIADNELAFKNEKDALKKKEAKFKAFRRCNLSRLCVYPGGILEDSSSLQLTYTRFVAAYNSYKVYESSFEAKPKPWANLRKKARRTIRKNMKDTLQLKKAALEAIHADITRSLEREIEISRRKFEDLENTKANIDDDQKKDKKSLIKSRNLLRKQCKKALEKKQKIDRKLKEATLELEFAKELGEEIDPEVLIIAPAEISVFINMKKVSMNVVELEDSILHVHIPPIEFDPALIELPDSATVYEVDNNKSELMISKQGAYFDLFGQLKEAVLEKQSEVKSKAIENGIIAEGEKMARSYLENFMRPLGLEMKFTQLKSDSLP